MITGGLNSPLRSISRKASNFPCSLPQKTSFCSILELAASLWPMMILIGEFMIEFASSSTLDVMVAEKMDRRSFGFEHAVRMRSVCSTNLLSNSLSTSSKTTSSTLLRSITSSPIRSIRRSGVETSMSNFELASTLLRNFPAIDLFKMPICRLLPLHNFVSSLKI
ncbi:hypothetical protein OGATHE_003887 [Ogataea polymorpha]|uniref:Uncharacterized protein n=1 Tax=Ogataea polymorpha TaxID=460523 RepID=A0A9P8P4H4_9ASCO|nr:hypothetical protein OGATHE_003887 [Ogataea polymorpha]